MCVLVCAGNTKPVLHQHELISLAAAPVKLEGTPERAQAVLQSMTLAGNETLLHFRIILTSCICKMHMQAACSCMWLVPRRGASPPQPGWPTQTCRQHAMRCNCAQRTQFAIFDEFGWIRHQVVTACMRCTLPWPHDQVGGDPHTQYQLPMLPDGAQWLLQCI